MSWACATGRTRGGALVGKASYHGHELLLVKPQSFMNTSGGPVSKLMRTHKAAPDHLIVIHDELDIDPGTIRVKFGGGHAGHNGLRSICDKLGTRDWYRVRIGIGRPPGRKPVVDWVPRAPQQGTTPRPSITPWPRARTRCCASSTTAWKRPSSGSTEGWKFLCVFPRRGTPTPCSPSSSSPVR
ncbi:MAG: aminoacyl-tRNA hydrolase [Adlercreutzia equolifaciens]